MVFGDHGLKCFKCYDRKAVLKQPSGPPSTVIAKGRKRGKIPSPIVDRQGKTALKTPHLRRVSRLVGEVRMAQAGFFGCERTSPTQGSKSPQKKSGKELALFRSLCNKRQLSRKNKSNCLTNFPECFPHLFLLHFEPKTSHNARFWGPNTLVF